MKRLSRWVAVGLLLVTVFFTVPQTEAAMDESVEPITADNMAAFVDAYVAAEMAAAHAPGLVVTVVYQGEVIMAKGYGVADVGTGRPMTPQTPLRAGSVSKPVTSAAILQLVARGALALDAPVTDYLPDLPPADDLGPAATVSQLLALQGGYADTVVRTHTDDLAAWQPLDAYLRDHLPPRVLPPGQVYIYNSWDHALLGQALATVQGEPFDRAIDSVLLQPLGMTSSTFTQPPPAALAAELARGYAYDDGRYIEVPLDYVQLTPGIGLVTTGADMGRFMVALLNDGVVTGERVLSAETVAGLLTRQESVHPTSRGRTYGLSEATIGDRRALYQNGNGIGQGNRLLLVPAHELGIFLSVNHRPLGRSAVITPAYQFMNDLSVALLERFVPAEAAEAVAVRPLLPDAAARAGRYAGHYRLAGTPQDDFFKLGALLDNVNVRANDDGTLTIGANRYREVEPRLFQSENTPGFHVVFGEDTAGAVSWLTFGGTGSYAKVSWYETPVFQLVLVGFILLASLATVGVMLGGGGRVWPVRVMGVLSALQIVFLLGVAGMMLRADLILFFKTVPLPTRLLFALPWLIGALALALPPALVAVLRQPVAGWVRLLAGLNTASVAGFLWFVRYWKLYGWF